MKIPMREWLADHLTSIDDDLYNRYLRLHDKV
jgi:hypothetical protein